MKLDPRLKVLTAALIFGSSGAFIKHLEMPVALITLFRLSVPVLIIGCYFAIKKQKPVSGPTGALIAASVLNALRMGLYFTGYTYTTIGRGVILLYTWPAFAALYAAFFLKERLTPLRGVGILAAMAGLAVMFSGAGHSLSDMDALGMAAMVLSAAVYAVTVIIFKKESIRRTPWEMVFFQNLIGAAIFLPIAALGSAPSLKGAGTAFVYAALIGVVGFGIFFSSLKELSASRASLLAYMEVPGGLAFGALLFGESLSMDIIIGGFFILFAALTAGRSEKRSTEEIEKSEN